MKITILGQEYKLHFGVSFVNEVDKAYFIDGGDMRFGTGVNNVWIKLQNSDPWALYVTIHAAIIGEHDLTTDEFDEWIDSLTEEEFESFFEKLPTELEKARQTGLLITKYKAALKKIENQAVKKLKKTAEVEGKSTLKNTSK